MNELLLSEIKSEEKSLIDSFSLIESFVFKDFDFDKQELNQIITACQNVITDVEEPLEQAEHLINEIFINQLLIDNNKKSWPVNSFQLRHALGFKMLSPVLKGAVICHILTCCGFSADMVYIPNKTMIRIVCDDVYAIIFDPITGESLNWQELDNRMDEFDGDPQSLHIDEVPKATLIAKHISGLKNALIKEKLFDSALKCVDMLIALRPDDPFERRDRGFLLHQLDCFKVAYDDYQYFVSKCPKEPAAQLLKIQLDKITIADTVLH